MFSMQVLCDFFFNLQAPLTYLELQFNNKKKSYCLKINGTKSLLLSHFQSTHQSSSLE